MVSETCLSLFSYSCQCKNRPVPDPSFARDEVGGWVGGWRRLTRDTNTHQGRKRGCGGGGGIFGGVAKFLVWLIFGGCLNFWLWLNFWCS